MYAVSSLPLISSLEDSVRWTQVWYVEHTSTGSTFGSLREWSCLVKKNGSNFGCFPEAANFFTLLMSVVGSQLSVFMGRIPGI